MAISFSLQNTTLANYSTMDATMTQIPNNTSVIDTGSLNSVGMSSTETPPPGYMSEDGDPMDQNDNLSECIVGDRTILDYRKKLPTLLMTDMHIYFIFLIHIIYRCKLLPSVYIKINFCYFLF